MELEQLGGKRYYLQTTRETLAGIYDILRTILQFSLDLSPEFTNEYIPDAKNGDLLALKALMEKTVASGEPGFALGGDQLRAFFSLFSELDALGFDARYAGLEQETYKRISRDVHDLLNRSVSMLGGV
jgi:hypothetical protein